MQVPREGLKGNMPHDLIVFRDGNGRQHILVPKCQRIALTQTEHETMLHVKAHASSTNYQDHTLAPHGRRDQAPSHRLRRVQKVASTKAKPVFHIQASRRERYAVTMASLWYRLLWPRERRNSRSHRFMHARSYLVVLTEP